MQFLHEARTTWTTRTTWTGISYLLQHVRMSRATARQAARGSAPGVCLENSSKRIIQVVQVIPTPLPQRFLATIRGVPFSAVVGRVVPAQLGIAQLGLARGRLPEGQALRSVVLSMSGAMHAVWRSE
jgi:hypothetical protein